MSKAVEFNLLNLIVRNQKHTKQVPVEHLAFGTTGHSNSKLFANQIKAKATCVINNKGTGYHISYGCTVKCTPVYWPTQYASFVHPKHNHIHKCTHVHNDVHPCTWIHTSKCTVHQLTLSTHVHTFVQRCAIVHISVKGCICVQVSVSIQGSTLSEQGCTLYMSVLQCVYCTWVYKGIHGCT